MRRMRCLCDGGKTLDHDGSPHVGVREVPDPYYGGPDGFERMLNLIEPASEALLERITATSSTR